MVGMVLISVHSSSALIKYVIGKVRSLRPIQFSNEIKMKKVKQKKDYTNQMWAAEVAFDKGSETPAPHFKVKGVTIINGKEYIVLDV